MPAGWWDGSTGNELQFIRGTCTDKTWSSPECPENCVAESVDGGEWVMRCGKNSSKYCCSADDCCSKASSNLFSMADPEITATAGVAPVVTSVNGTTTTIPSTTSVPTASTTSATTTTGEKATQPTATSPPTETKSTNGDTGLSHSQTVAIGAGAGAGAGVLGLGCLLGCLCWRRRRRRRKEEAFNTFGQAGSSQGGSEWDNWSQPASRRLSHGVKELASDSPFDRGLTELSSKNHRSVYEVE
ncbi:uncharacterized protein N7506_004955 [Penicillium brevicompactum]|uniref:uncharacterized protein n=1 Tax=Penicillium brevicompactum TaxID=5074 RepID=UPI002541078F|nr:uncharacterized protein N7506_004955 [Penicillium brevicompactum]KAJ5336933.1 hypothetical protein N7506_004955 [Penicillium brevicompactum]